MPPTNTLPARLTNIQPRRDLGTATPAIGSALAGAGSVAAAGSSLASFIPALAPLLSNPITAGIGVLLGGVLGAAPYIYNKIKQGNINKKIEKSQQALQQLALHPQQDSEKVQREIKQHQNILQGYLNQGQAEQTPQPGQQLGNIPQNDFWQGRQAYNEQIPLYTPNTEQYREGVVNELRNNSADFGPIREQEVRRFHEETAPRIAEQYFGRNPNSFSGSYPEALGRGGANLGRNLAADEQRFKAERESRLMNVANQPSFTTYRNPREPGFNESFLAPLIGQAGGSALNYGANWLQNKFGAGSPSVGTPENPQIMPQGITPRQAPQATVNSNVYGGSPVVGNALQQFQGLPAMAQNPLQKLFKSQYEAKGSQLGGRTR